jgi:hypothetical protein
MSAVTPEQCDAIYRTDVYAFAQATAAELEPATKFEPTWHHEDRHAAGGLGRQQNASLHQCSAAVI